MSMQDFSLQSHIEAILFFKGEPVTIDSLIKTLETDRDSIEQALHTLSQSLNGRGVVLVRNDDEVALATSTSASSVIEKITKEELISDLGKAGLETLAIILYKGLASRRDIDSIRGVNSSFILRNLSIRGLIERAENDDGERGYYYKPTTALIAHLGISRIEDLPEYDSVREDIAGAIEDPHENEYSHEI